jgi:iron complex transport system permease protein
MITDPPTRPRPGDGRPIAPRRSGRLALGLAAALGLLALVAFLSVALGTRAIPVATVVEALVDPRAGDTDHDDVRDLRLPRTLIGIVVGAALGLAGAITQGITRNPIADPGLLGINAGAALAVVAGITWFGAAGAAGYVWFAFGGAAVAALVVYGIGVVGRGGATPVRLALVGAAFTAAAGSLTTIVVLSDIETLDRYRFWIVGSLVGRGLDSLVVMAPFMVVGAVLALSAGRVLNALSLGDDVATGLGQRLALARGASAAAVVLLCGTATALAGPIVFVGLVVPHVARRFTGPDYRWILAYCAPLGAVLLVASDIAGRLIARPGELEAGIVLAFLGAPVMIAIVRGSRLSGL